jgi:cyclopropane fatty-acyl-phospholipid synthase-like methyltransferase
MSEIQHNHIKEIKRYFDQWNIYQKVIQNNYMFHEQIYHEVHELLLNHFRQEPLSLLDLGCGDSSLIAKNIKDVPIYHYHGIDISEIALDAAKKNFALYSLDIIFSSGDYFEIIKRLKTKFDVIVSGYSLHHLPLWQKDMFFGNCHNILKKNGILLIYDIIKNYDENNEKYLERYWNNIQINRSDNFTIKELEDTKKHIFQRDLPESIETLTNLANKHGFKQANILYRDPLFLIGLICWLT